MKDFLLIYIIQCAQTKTVLDVSISVRAWVNEQ